MKKKCIVIKAVINETAIIKVSFIKSKSVKLVALYTPKQQAASNTGIPVKRENVILNLLLIPRNLIAVITVPDLLIPGIKAKI